MRLRAVIFDMDGLMIDSERVYWAAGRAVAARRGVAVADATLGRMMGRSPVDSMTVFAAETNIAEDPAALLTERDAAVYDLFAAGVDPMPGLYEALDRLAGRFELGIATSARRAFVDVIDARVNFVRYFKVVQTSEGVTNGKPHPEIYLTAMARLGAEPAACAVLEDSSNGARAGKSAGAYTVAVPNEHTRDQDFSFVDYVAKDLLDAVRRIDSVAVAG